MQDGHRWPPRLGVRAESNRWSAASRSAPNAALLALADAGNARTTTSAPGGKNASRERMR
jgi:hypothetical protein